MGKSNVGTQKNKITWQILSDKLKWRNPGSKDSICLKSHLRQSFNARAVGSGEENCSGRELNLVFGNQCWATENEDSEGGTSLGRK